MKRRQYPDPGRNGLRREIARSAWLAAHGICVPPVLETTDDGLTIAALIGALPGAAPHKCGRPLAEIVDLVAGGNCNLYELF